MKSTPYLAAAALAVLATEAQAQLRQIVNPANRATVEGVSRIGFPWGGNSPLRYQQICGLSADPTAIGLMNRVAFRRDNDTAVTSGDYAAFNPDFQLSVSTSPRTTMTMSKTFATNIGTDVQVVHTGSLNWPAQVKVPPGPTAFAYTVPFTTPFLYVSTTGDILLDFAVTSPNNTNTSFFADADSASGGSVSRQLGAGCPAGVNLVSVFTNWGPGSTARILQYSGAGNVPSVLSIGSTSPTYGGVPLPFDLAPLGAPGCMVYHDNLLQIQGTMSGTSGIYTGRWDFSFVIPNNPMLAGFPVRTQFINLGDTGANNPLNLSVSAGHEITIATPAAGRPPQSEAHASGLSATEGALLQQGYGMVTEFQFL
jgi:hypothetical protein